MKIHCMECKINYEQNIIDIILKKGCPVCKDNKYGVATKEERRLGFKS